ncbi:hypothetical protein DYI23_09725 [Roseibium polysiphoniae]|uniref:Uncharacterized protein n=1 Tax=Roseibium polysiphoniae TaxID=2571221 RepID=A0A944CDJ3_9HYPH|nr:hypothetical protein [Roseibium polysiphoniae]MBS8260495.1 hypothetical protein [Roseibium polysiphoniae]
MGRISGRIFGVAALSGFAALGLVASGSVQQAGASDFFDRLSRSEQIRENEAAGGPKVKGANSPYMQRVQVCKSLPTEIRDKATGQVQIEMRERCWFE